MPKGEKASGSQDNLESTHESKGKRCRPRNIQKPKPNTQGPPPVRKDNKQKNKSNPSTKSNPKTKPKT